MVKRIFLVVLVIISLFISTVITAYAGSPNDGYPDWAWGSTFAMQYMGKDNEVVRLIQHHLAHSGYFSHSYIDGDFGTITQSKVMDFQDDHGLDSDGYVGPATWSHLQERTFLTSNDGYYNYYHVHKNNGTHVNGNIAMHRTNSSGSWWVALDPGWSWLGN